MITVAGKVRDVLGADEELSIDDAQIETLIKQSEKQVRRDVFKYHYQEEVGDNPDTGASWDGSNTRFQIGRNIADYDFDESTTDDVTGVWLDSSYEPQTCSVTVHNARYGLLDVYQSDGSTAIPLTAEEVTVDYYNSDTIIPFDVLEEMGTLLVCHKVKRRLTEPKQMNLADLESNQSIIRIYDRDFLNEYKDLVNKYREPLLKGT